MRGAAAVVNQMSGYERKVTSPCLSGRETTQNALLSSLTQFRVLVVESEPRKYIVRNVGIRGCR